MQRTHLVVAIRADKQQMTHITSGEKVYKEIKRRYVEPLQVIDKQHQRMFGPREHGEETSEHQLESSLSVLRKQLGDRYLLADDQFQLRDQVHHEQPIRAQRFTDRLTPVAEFDVAHRQERTDQALKDMRAGGVWDLALVLVEFSRRKKAP